MTKDSKLLETFKSVPSDFSYQIIDFKLLNESEKKVLLKKLFEIYGLNLKGRDFLKFQEQFFDKTADSVEILILKRGSEDVSGYILFRRYDTEFPKKVSAQSSNKYAVFKVQVSFSKQLQGNKYLEYSLLSFFGNYYQKNLNVNIILFDSALNPISYRVAHVASAYTFPSPIYSGNETVEEFIDFLRDYFGYELMDKNDKHVIRSASTLTEEINLQKIEKDPLIRFFCGKTHMEPHAGLIAIYCFHLVVNNSLNLPARTKWPSAVNSERFFRPLKENADRVVAEVGAYKDKQTSDAIRSRL